MAESDNSKYIPLYFTYLDQFQLLTDSQVGALTIALLNYGRSGKKPDFPQGSGVEMAFSFIAANTDRAIHRRQEIIEKRREAGQKGGQKTAETTAKDEKGRFVQANQANFQTNPVNRPSVEKNVQANPSKSNPNKDKDKDKDKDKSSSIDADGRIRADDDDDSVFSPVVDTLYSQIVAVLPGKVPRTVKSDLAEMLTNGMSESEIQRGISEAAARDAKTWVYVKKAILSAKASEPSGRRERKDKLHSAGILIKDKGT